MSSSLLSRGRRSELSFILAFLGCAVLIPLTLEKIFPFDRPSFFVASVRRHSLYEITDPQGRQLPLHAFGLGDFYWGQRGWFSEIPVQERGAIKLPDTINIYGEVASEQQVRAMVRRHLADSNLAYVDVVQRVKARADGQTVGVVSERRWRVSNAPAAE